VFLVNISLEFDVLPLASMQASASCVGCDLEAVSTQLHAAPAPRPFLADVMEVQHTLITCGCGCAPRWRITIKPLELLVAAGPFGGARVIQNLLPVMRELGLVTIFWDVNFSSVQNVFDPNGLLLDPSYIRRIDKFLKELIWMSRTLRHGREGVSLQ